MTDQFRVDNFIIKALQSGLVKYVAMCAAEVDPSSPSPEAGGEGTDDPGDEPAAFIPAGAILPKTTKTGSPVDQFCVYATEISAVRVMLTIGDGISNVSRAVATLKQEQATEEEIQKQARIKIRQKVEKKAEEMRKKAEDTKKKAEEKAAKRAEDTHMAIVSKRLSELERARVDEDNGASPEPGREPAPHGGRGRSAEYKHSK